MTPLPEAVAPPDTRVSIPLVEITRGPLVESTHHGSLAVVTEDGSVLASAGDIRSPIYARSSLKPLQAVAMLRGGLDLPDELLALSAASHSGARYHREGAAQILSRYGLDAAALRNVADFPYGAPERELYVRDGGLPSQLAQNCSGKHAAMAATCVVNGWTTDDYLDPQHPLQLLIVHTLDELMGEQSGAVTTDGCGAPAFAYSLASTARSYARFASAAEGSHENKVFRAMRAHPEMVAGGGRDVTALMQSIPGLVAKEGAEGVQLFGLRDQKIGVAVKIADGADRSRLPITLRILEHLGIETAPVRHLTNAQVLGGGHPVGELRPAASVERLLLTMPRELRR